MTTTPSSELKTEPKAPWAARAPGTRWLRNRNIGSKLSLGFSLLVLLLIIGIGFGLFASARAIEQIRVATETRVPIVFAAGQAQANLLRMESNIRGYLALGQREFRDGFVQSQANFEVNLRELQGFSDELPLVDQARLETLQTEYAAWETEPPMLFDLRDDRLEREPAYKELAVTGVGYGGQVLIDTQKLIDLQADQAPSQENIELLQEMAQFQGSFAALFSGLRNYVNTQDRRFKQEYDVNLALNEQDWKRLQEQEGALSEAQLVLFASIIQNRADFLALPEETIFPVLESDQARLDLYQFREELVPRTTLMLDLLSDLTNNEFQQMQSELEAGSTGLMRARVSTIVVGVTAVILSVVLSLILRENIAGPIVRLTAVAETIQGGSLDSNAQVESQDEIGILAATFNRMTSQLRSTLRQVRKERDRADNLLNVVIPIGVELSSEQDFNRMLEKMLVEAKTFCNADAGSLYLRTEEDTLRFVIVRNSTQNITLGGTSGQPVTFAPLPLYLDGAPNRQHVATAVALSGETINIANAYETTDYDFSGPPQFDAQTGYHTQSMLTIPLKNSLGDVKGILQLLNAQDQSGAIIPFDANLQQMMESFSSLAVAALEAYIREQVLRQEIQQLRIEIDEAKLQKTVSETVDSDFFQNLQAQAREIRRRRQESREQSEDQSST